MEPKLKRRKLEAISLADQPISLDVPVVDHLGPVVEFLQSDCEICKASAKGTYTKSGNFSKK